MTASFREELRRWRQEFGLDLAALSRFGPMTDDHLAQIEAGTAPDLAQLLHPLGYTLGRACRMAVLDEGERAEPPQSAKELPLDEAPASDQAEAVAQLAATLAPAAAAVFMAGFNLGYRRRS